MTDTNKPTLASSGLLTTKEAAAFLGIAALTLSSWRRQGYGPSYIELSPRHCYYREADILAWFEQRVKVPTASEPPTLTKPNPAEATAPKSLLRGKSVA